MQRENDAQISGLGVMKKAPSQWKTEKKKKKDPSSLLVKVRSSKWCAKIFFK